jgi:Flp pilus assembly protein TadD
MSAVLTRDSSLNTLKKAGWIFYSVFERAQTSEQLQRKAVATRSILEKVVRLDPDDLSAKSKLAMTLVSTENPMVGIALLREVLASDSEFREAILDLGILSVQSGQFDRGIERFERLLVLNDNDQEARVYLGVCYMESGQSDLAEKMFAIVVENQSADPALVVAAQEYLNELRN